MTVGASSSSFDAAATTTGAMESSTPPPAAPPPPPSRYYGAHASPTSQFPATPPGGYAERDYEEIYYHFDDYAQDVVMANPGRFIAPPEPGE